MDFLEQVTSALSGDQSKAPKALGVLFMAIRFSLNNEAFAHIERAFPDADHWVMEGAGLGGRTGEMIGLIDADSLASNLADSGLSEDEIARFGEVAGSGLRTVLPTDVFQELVQKIPFLDPAAR